MSMKPERNYFAEMIDNIVTEAATRREVTKAVVVEEVKEFVAEIEEMRRKYLDDHP